MTFSLRTARRWPALALALLLPLGLVLAGPAGAGAPTPQPPTPPASAPPAPDPSDLPPSALPPLPPQTDPWLYRGSDVPHDKEWYFGTLANGLKWAVRANGVPPRQVSIRIRMDVGSLHERLGEEGFAHLIEHLVFRQSRWLGEAQAIPAWQRLGATFGTDTNAETSPLHTVFKIDLPAATPASLNESFKLLSGMMIAPTLSESDIRTEVPIVLAEKRERGGIAERIQDATRAVIFAGQPMADHATIGSVDSINGAHEAAVRAFHQRWYRPENAAIIVSGDADPRLLAALIAKWFGDWPVVGAGAPQPDFGTPQPMAGANPADPAHYIVPIGPARVVVVPDQPRALVYAIERPWHEKNDTIVYNQGLMIDQLAAAILNRRLERRARAGAAYLAAQVEQANEARSLDLTHVNITPLGSDWRGALRDVRTVIADALARPPEPEEITREVAEINVAFESAVQQRALQPGGRVADDLVQALDIHETVAAPETVLALFRGSTALFTPQAVLEHTRKLFAGAALRAVYVTPDASDGDDAALARALLAPVSAAPATHAAAKPISFAKLPPIGPPGPVPTVTAAGVEGIEQLDLGNGVRVLFWPTQDDPGRVTVKLRFGAGLRAFAPGEIAAATLGNMTLVSMGEGALGQEELDRVTTGRKVGFQFHTDEGFFGFSAETRAEDLADQLYLLADKFAQPRWDAAPLRRTVALAQADYAALASSPQGVLERDLRHLRYAADPRYATPTPDELARVTPEGFRKVWAPILAHGPIEIELFGDVDRAAAITALRRSFGALPPRDAQPVIKASDSPAYAQPNPQPLVLTHKGEANQAAAIISWPTGGGLEGLRTGRHLDILAQLFQNRLMQALREKAGAAYAPQVGADWPVDLAAGGTITAQAELQPAMVPAFFATADAIAADLAAHGPTADELALVLGPMREQISRAASSTAFFMNQIEGATQQPARLSTLRSLFGDYTRVSPAELQELAQRYLGKDRAWRLAVLPAGVSYAALPPAPPAPPAPSGPPPAAPAPAPASAR